MAQSNWEADKMLDVYIYDYLMKKELHATAKSFMNEGRVAPDPVAIDAPGGFLFEWWSVFWDIFIARTNDKHSESAAVYIEAQQIKAKEQQMQQLQLMRQAQLQRTPSNPPLGGALNSLSSEGMLGQSASSALAAKMYEERMKHPNQIDSETSQPLLDARAALLKSTTNHPGQLVQGNPGNVNPALQQIQARNQQTADIKSEINMGASQRSLPVDSSIYAQGMMQPKPVIGNSGLNPGVSGLPLKGWPLTGIDQMQPGLGAQVQKPFLQGATQFQILSQQQQQLLAQVQTQGNVGSTPGYGDMRGLPRGNLNSKDGQPIINNGSIGSTMQTTTQINMPQMQHSSSQQQDPLQSQQVQQNNRKRKGPSSSGAANSTGTGNTVGPSSNSQPSTPSTHTPGDGIALAGNLPNASNVPKSLMMYGTDETGGLVSSTNQLEDIDQFGDVGSLEDNVESFLSHDDGEGRDLFGTLNGNPAHSAAASKGFSFTEVGSICKSSSKVVCCHFSSDGKLLASAGHDKKVVVWNMDTLQTESTLEDHSLIITDVRFRPNSTQLATSSFDTTVRLWDAAEPNYCLQTYKGHTSHVMSLDFHPKKTDLFCSCDTNNEIRFWNINQYSCTRVIKGGSSQVRFQPRIGQFMAAASGNVVSIFDAESDRQTHSLQGHSTEVHSLCWDTNGDYLSSVSQESVRVWSLSTGKCIHELSSSGNMFHSCVFHPSYSTLLVIGGYQSMELWNMADNKCMTVAAHDCVISALAQSPVTGMVASASHDKSVKIWK
ncbi:PREDICTED: transcriptional corepressor LEUNIG [Fragaria vesca subsp. vesca]|uniref:transcriptional corepressor LEUNIG n=1 Tax=Fragaria vesca subsp. vesca TaxID=101020 RepID=UPI0002C35AAF|nr:PREDICTED: transcriptional corepressor LEUNIG [Fragaria vesca subsp. vesca]XP_011462525.1 PREDICTED: transcriptional corepressor LEUNIG [Fragaria vesca subsp. vesca]